jgi:hypothetical protein
VIDKSSQLGLTVTGLLFGGIALVLLAVFGLKVVPEVVEYAKIVSNIKALSQDPSLKQASIADIRSAYYKRADVDHITALAAQDLDISKNGNTVVLSFAYTKRIPLGGPVSLLIDFEASTEK